MASGIDGATGVQFASGQAVYDHVLTNFFLPVMADARNNSSVLWNQIKKGAPTQVSGRFIVFPVRTTRNTGRNAIRPGGKLPDPGTQGYKTYSLETRTLMGRIKVDGDIIRRVKENGGAFADSVTLEMEGQIDDMTVDANRMIHNDGSGRLCELASGSTTTYTLRVNQSIEGAATCTTKPVLHLEVGDRIAFYDSANDAYHVHGSTTTQQGYYVRTILSNSTIEIAATPGGAALSIATGGTTIAAGDWIVRYSTEVVSSGANACGGARAEPVGIGGIMSDAGILDGNGIAGSQQSGSNTDLAAASSYVTTSLANAPFQGLAASTTNPWNQATVLDNSGVARPITEALMQQAISDAEEKNNANITLLLSSYATYNSYVQLLTPDKRYNDTLELKGGHKMLSFNGIPWVKDRFAYGNRVYFLAMDEFQCFEVESLRPLDYMGQPRWERLHDTDAYWTGHVQSYNVGVHVRQRAGAVLVDLAA